MKEGPVKSICYKIKELRLSHGFSQDQVAFALNMQQNSYSRLERGETKLDVERLYQIAGLYKISIFILLDEKLQPELFKSKQREGYGRTNFSK